MTKDELTIFRRRKIGFVFQNYNLLPLMNVYENVVLNPPPKGGPMVNMFWLLSLARKRGAAFDKSAW